MQTQFQQIRKHDRITNLNVSLIYDEEGKDIGITDIPNAFSKQT